MSNEKDKPKLPKPLPALNTIYYGPPGTGKTYTLNQLKEEFTEILNTSEQEAKIEREAYMENINSLNKWEIAILILSIAEKEYMESNDIVKHHIFQKSRFGQKSTMNPGPNLTSAIGDYADKESGITRINKAEDKQYFSCSLKENSKIKQWKLTAIGNNYYENKLKNIADMIEQISDTTNQQNNNNAQRSVTEKNYQFITFHQKYGYEDFIEGIKPLIQENDANENTSSNLSFEIRRGIFYNACREALELAGYDSYYQCYNDTPENRKKAFEEAFNEKKYYAIFIDEINRANISAVFGELITLIEDTKRIGASEEMWLTLPVSGDKFCVPPNLYIIGTMNTADRSVALLDIALRRRFSFEYMGPDYKLVGDDWSDLLKALNKIIYEKKKNTDFFIGHSFFLDVNGKPKPRDKDELADIFNTKIIPLLMEYFQNNVDVVKEILEELKKVDSSIKFDTPSIENNFILKLKE